MFSLRKVNSFNVRIKPEIPDEWKNFWFYGLENEILLVCKYHYKATNEGIIDKCPCEDCTKARAGKELYSMYEVVGGEKDRSIIPVYLCEKVDPEDVVEYSNTLVLKPGETKVVTILPDKLLVRDPIELPFDMKHHKEFSAWYARNTKSFRENGLNEKEIAFQAYLFGKGLFCESLKDKKHSKIKNKKLL